VLEYNNGGKLLVSCGHWMELNSLDLNEEKFLDVLSKNNKNMYEEIQLNTCNMN